MSRHIYNGTMPYRLIGAVFGESDEQFWSVVLRKLYSIIAFTIVGFVVDQALGRGRRRALRAASIVAVFSAFIEIAQKLHHAREGLPSNLFDVACGAAGGWCGAMIGRALRRVRRR